MRIAYICETYPPEINGVSLTVTRTVGYLRTRGHQVESIRPCQPGEVRGGDAGEWRSAGDPLAIYPDLRFGIGRPCTLAHRFAGLGTELVHVATKGPLG